MEQQKVDKTIVVSQPNNDKKKSLMGTMMSDNMQDKKGINAFGRDSLYPNNYASLKTRSPIMVDNSVDKKVKKIKKSQ